MRGGNNFDTLRLAAALAVVASHASVLADGSYANEPVFRLSHGQTTLGGLAVFGFFVLSGYLITRSFTTRASLRGFVAARALRIGPGLAVAVLVTAGVVGPLFSRWAAGAYFRSWVPYAYVASNVALLHPMDRLPGLFLANPFPVSVNGSLWTLRHEVVCYGLVVLLGAAGLLTRGVVTALFAAAVGALAALGWTHSGPEFVTDFLAGAVLFLWQPFGAPGALVWRGRVAALCGAACAVSLAAGGFAVVAATAGAFGLVHLAAWTGLRLPRFGRFGDLSYGVYIYAFPIEQAAVQVTGGRPGLIIAASLPFILLLAALSWHLVETRAMRWARRVGRPGDALAGINAIIP